MEYGPKPSRSLTASLALILGTMLAAPSGAQSLETRFDILSPGDPGYDEAPPDRLIVDAYLDVGATDVWAASLFHWMEVDASVSLVLRRWPGPDDIVITNPDDPHVTSVSRPMDRNVPERWSNAGVSGGATSTESGPGLINLSATWSPLAPEPPGADGYIARLVFELDASAPPRETLRIDTEPPPPDTNLLAYALWDTLTAEPVHVVTEVYMWSVPEPSAGLFMIVLAAIAARSRRQ